MTVTREEKIYRAGIDGRIDQIESVLQIPGETGEGDQSVCLSGWRHWVEKKLRGFERSETLETITRTTKLGAASEEIRIANPSLLTETLTNLKKKSQELDDLGREHELELYGEGNGNGLTRRLERVEEAGKILLSEIWWIRKGVLLVLILTLWSLIQMWWRFGWFMWMT